MTPSRRETRTVPIKLSRVDWAWIVRDLLRRHVTLEKYVAQVLEGEIAMQREGRRDRRSALTRPTLPGSWERAERPVLAVER